MRDGVEKITMCEVACGSGAAASWAVEAGEFAESAGGAGWGEPLGDDVEEACEEQQCCRGEKWPEWAWFHLGRTEMLG